MKELKNQYETAKINATECMKNGQIASYLQSLIEMNNYKKLMIAVRAN